MARELAGTSGAAAPFFSPGGQWVGFFTSSRLRKVSLLTGNVVTICNVRVQHPNRTGTWGQDDTILIATTLPGALLKLQGARKERGRNGRGHVAASWAGST